MPRLKDRNRFVPGGFQVIHPEAGMKQPFSGSFNAAVEFEFNFRKSNPFLTKKHGWSTNRSDIEREVEDYNVKRCLASGWLDFVMLDAPVQSAASSSPGQKKTLWQSAVGSVKRIANGEKLIQDWLGSGRKPVDKPLAEQRAAVCATCPKNDGGDFTTYFTEPIANQIRWLLGVKHDMDLKTSLDEKLTVCSGCDCPLPLKVWSPLDLVRKHTDSDTMARLDPRCWVLNES